MNKLAFIIIAALAVTACGNNYRSSNRAAQDETDTVKTQMVGAFGDQREIEQEEMEMFRKATASDSLVVYTPLSVSTQVVAGTNYKFWCRFEDKSDGIQRKAADDSDKYGYCWIKIFKPLPGQGEPKVTSNERVAAEKNE